jgi:hypothetical protein
VLPHVVPLASYRDKLEKANVELNARIEGLHAVVARAKVTPTTDAKAMRDLSSSARAAQGEYDAALAARDQLAAGRDECFAGFQAAANQHARDFSQMQTEFLTLARTELGIVGDAIQPHEVEENFERAQAALKKLRKAMGLPD